MSALSRIALATMGYRGGAGEVTVEGTVFLNIDTRIETAATQYSVDVKAVSEIVDIATPSYDVAVSYDSMALDVEVEVEGVL